LSNAVGRFYTQGFPADSKALSSGVLSSAEYLSQAKIVLAENLKAFEYQLDQYRDGCFYFYFSSIDQNCHMLWRCMDPSHPLYEPDAPPEVKNAVRWFYQQMDKVLAKALTKVDNDTLLIALSDHGFAPFTREFHITTWLANEGFTKVDGAYGDSGHDFFTNVDWRKTSAYAIGLNGIYLNLEGRERDGSLPPSQAGKIKREIAEKLVKVKDPKNGKPIFTKIYDAQEIYSGPYTELAPDLVVGYQRGYRISDRAAFGKFPAEIIGDRNDAWSADHCLDPQVVPGMLLMNQPCTHPNPGLWDLAPTLISGFGLSVPREMEGRSVISL
jgi:predicted AlkP superfamily phosphohydrolase/phosphomutase